MNRFLIDENAEIIVDKAPWTLPAQKFADSDLVPVRIAYTEEVLRQAAKSAKGRWNPDIKL